jgi:hypothetical protein
MHIYVYGRWACGGTQCTCFTGTKVQILTQKALQAFEALLQQMHLLLDSTAAETERLLRQVPVLRPYATSACGLKLLVHEALSCCGD